MTKLINKKTGAEMPLINNDIEYTQKYLKSIGIETELKKEVTNYRIKIVSEVEVVVGAYSEEDARKAAWEHESDNNLLEFNAWIDDCDETTEPAEVTCTHSYYDERLHF